MSIKEILKDAGYSDYEIAVYRTCNPPSMGNQEHELFQIIKDKRQENKEE